MVDPHIRAKRGMNFVRAFTRHLMNKYPLQFWMYSTYGVISFAAFSYHLYKEGIWNEHSMPYYRRYYEVVRPDDPRALNARAPEDYPAPWLSNRETTGYKYYKKDYGWKADI